MPHCRKGASSMDEKTDVISMDFPEYEEEYSPFPNVITEFPFAESKEEVYDRNIRLAEKMELAEIRKEEAVRKRKHKRKRLPSFRESEKRQLILAATVVIALVVITAAFSDSPKTNSEEYYDFESPAEYEYVDSLENIEVEQHLEKLENHFYSSTGLWDITIRFTVKNNGSNTVGITPADFLADFESDNLKKPETDFYWGTVFIVKSGEQAEFTLTYSDIKYALKITDKFIAVLSELKGFYYGDNYIDADSELLEEIKKAIFSSEP